MQVTTGRKIKPPTILFYGVEGVGKTTWASKAKNPIFIGDEKNDEFDFPRVKVDSYDDFLTALDKFYSQYSTIVIDTVDGIERLLHQKIAGGKSMETACGGYGKAYIKAYEDMQKLLARFDEINSQEKTIILLCHDAKIKHSDPLTPDTDYDTYVPSLHNNAKGVGVRSLVMGWVSCILFANYAIGSTKEENGKRYVVGEGDRRIFTEKRPGYAAKNRFGLPHEIQMDYKSFALAVASYYKKPEEERRKDRKQAIWDEITELLKKTDDADFIHKVTAHVQEIGGDIEKLTKALARVRKVVGGI